MGRPVANRMPVGNRMPGPLLPDPIVMSRPPAVSPDLAPNGRNIEYGNHLPVDSMSRPGRETVPLPPDASNTLYVEGLPPDSSRREVARILFIGGDATSKLILIFFFTFQLFTEKRQRKKKKTLFLYSYICTHKTTFLHSHVDIFRPFVGYKELRLVSKESKHVIVHY